MNAILNAINKGFSSKTVLNYLKQKAPQAAYYINTAQNLGYTANNILHKLSGDKENDSEAYMTEFEKTLNAHKQNRRKSSISALGVLGTAGAAGAGLYQAYKAGQPIRPSQILPAQRPPQQLGGPGATIPVQPRPRGGPPGLPAPRQALTGPAQSPMTQPAPIKGLYRSPGETKVRGRQPSESKGVIQLGGPKEEEFPAFPELNAVKNKQVVTQQLWDLAQKGKTSGNEFLKNSSKLVKNGTITDIANFGNFYNWWNVTQGQPRGGPLVEYEKFRVQTRGMFEPPAEVEEKGMAQAPQAPVAEEAVQQIQPEPMQQPEAAQAALEETQAPQVAPVSIHERVQQAAFADKPHLKRLVDASFKDKEFAIPTYRFPNESAEDFANRKLINEAIKKSAKALAEGASFLDFPIPPEAIGVGGLSTAEDVLRFMGGIPNVYDPLLDDQEKQELYDGLLESGMSEVEGLRPSQGERNIYGAQITPNLIWNMLLVQEPRLRKIERPPAIKGATIPGDKMDTAGFRRALTHSVYGVLSGRNISPELADKIGKISQVVGHLDVIAKAAFDGNFRAAQREMEKMADDDYFMSLFTDEVDRMARASRGKSEYPTLEEASEEDTKSASYIRAQLKKRNKKK